MAKAELFQKDIPKKERVFYYESEEDDPIKTDEQEKKVEVGLPEGYEFIPKNPFVRLYSATLFRIFKLFGQYYERGYWQTKFYGREKLKEAKGKGYVIYANHTNPFHDVFGPALAADRRIFTVISPVNLKIPGIGKFLPMIGGLPLGKTPEEKKAFNDAVDKRLKQKKVLVIYPEAHVWPYTTKIRKFPAGDRSFKYAVRNNLPIFTMTTTYHKRKNNKKGDLPRMDVYVDGPFWPDKNKTEDENRAMLSKKAYDSMVKYSKNNTYEYFEYRKKTKK
ncbi:1-acyl-sn-glycerol-3-phosphate acyltransferase [Candidatus Saccharibacteria bacterium]|nr:1-acyl-sn-glycerol-3-phosphate acyltransferase [Candidatus Saccharibacteria bacterium]MBQ1540348.1 1-acyl-sn-glycerol-3-phosphate acyltransferase [Candidatus Saccharibacteria bacterium]